MNIFGQINRAVFIGHSVLLRRTLDETNGSTAAVHAIGDSKPGSRDIVRIGLHVYELVIKLSRGRVNHTKRSKNRCALAG